MSSKKHVIAAQQELAENCGYGNDTIWDLQRENESELMMNKIKQLIPDQPKREDAIFERRNTIFQNVWKQRKYTNKMSLTSIFYVMVTNDTNFQTALYSTTYSCHPVFRCKKCDNDSDTSQCCMIYVDETGRVYRNWSAYINENVLPAGTMITPRRGIYNFDKYGHVILDVYCTPKGTPAAKLMTVTENSSSVLGVGASAVTVAAIFLPLSAPFVASAGLVAMGVGAFSAVRSALNLQDRKDHDQSISLANREARGNYLGVLGGGVGIAAAGTARVMKSMASAGKATASVEALVNGFNLSSIVLSGSGVANGVLDLIFKYNDGDEISSMDILQLSASLVLFTHSIYNFQLASQMANNARNKSIKSYRETLSNRQRKMFDKLSKETLRIRGAKQGKMDIIRGVNEIPDRKYLNDLFKISKNLNKHKIRPAFGTSGKSIVLNNELAVNTAELRQSVQHQKGPNILEQVSQSIGAVRHSVDVKLNENWNAATIQLAQALQTGVINSFQLAYKTLLNNVSDVSKFGDIIDGLFTNLSDCSAKFILNLAETFLRDLKYEIERKIKTFISAETVLYRLLQIVLDKFLPQEYTFISQKGPQILEYLKQFFVTLEPIDINGKKQICSVCHGQIILSKL